MLCMKQSILGYVAIGIVAILISLMSTSRIMQEERDKTRRKVLSIHQKQEQTRQAEVVTVSEKK
jgi:hypothetical protein